MIIYEVQFLENGGYLKTTLFSDLKKAYVFVSAFVVSQYFTQDLPEFSEFCELVDKDLFMLVNYVHLVVQVRKLVVL